MSKADDFIKDMEAKANLSIEDWGHLGNILDAEDLEVILKLINDMNSTTMVLSMGPMIALMSAFVAGVAWAKYRAEADSPLNDLLDSVKGL